MYVKLAIGGLKFGRFLKFETVALLAPPGWQKVNLKIDLAGWKIVQTVTVSNQMQSLFRYLSSCRCCTSLNLIAGMGNFMFSMDEESYLFSLVQPVWWTKESKTVLSSPVVSKLLPFVCLYKALGALFLPLIRDTILPTDRGNETPFLPLTPTMGHCSST